MSELYKRLLSLCDQCQISITEMCKQAGVTRSILSEFGSGRTKHLSTGTLVKICAFFGVTTDYMSGMISSDTARCPVCGYQFPLPNEKGAVAHAEYHDRFESLRQQYIYVYPMYRSEKMITMSEDDALKAKFSQSVLKHGSGHPDFDEYADLVDTEKLEHGYLFEPSADAPAHIYEENDRPDDDMTMLPHNKIRMIPLYESASAGFGAQATGTVVDYMPLFIMSDAEADSTMCIKVVGNSMYPKIEDGDIVQVLKTPSVDSGKIAVVLLDDDEGLIKRVVYGDDWVELQSINPEYAPRRFEGADVQRIRVVGLVKRIIKEC